MKKCTNCGEVKPPSEFGKKKGCAGGLRPCCKTCSNKVQRQYYATHFVENKASQKKYYEANKEKILAQRKEKYRKDREKGTKKARCRDPKKIREYALRTKYRIDAFEYNKVLEEQGGFCAICGGSNNGKTLAVDHDHETNQVRGLLCAQCNTVLGLIHDDPVIASRIIFYLGEFQLLKVFGIPVELPAAGLEKMELIHVS